jgi:hypothetical protein
MEVTSKEELNEIISSFQDKILDLDECLMEFYLGFYDKIKENLLSVVEESKLSRKVIGDMNIIFLASIPE